MTVRLLSVFLAAALLAPLPAWAGMKVTTVQDYYDISGSTAKQLKQQMDRMCSRKSTSNDCWGHTDWHVRWRYHYGSDEGGCQLSDIKVSVEITYVLPRWPVDAGDDTALRAEWDKMIQALTLHENGHGAHALDVGRRIEKALKALPPALDCDAAQEAANATGKALIRQANDEDVAYDETTRHGRTQGVSLP